LAPLSAPVNAATTRISGVGVVAPPGECGPPPAGYEEFVEFTMVITGDLDGCWYTVVDTRKTTPSGVYLETGREVFVSSSLDGSTFATTYKFESKWAPDGSEVHGRCQHPIVAGSGTGDFAGATGRVDFKDEVTTGQYFYRGHIK